MKSEAKEQQFLAERPVKFRQDGDTVFVTARKPGKVNWSWNWGSLKTEGKYSVRVPAKFNVKLDTRGGHIHVRDLTGEVKADTGGGGLKFARLHGPINGDTSGGSIQLIDCDGILKVNTSGGSGTLFQSERRALRGESVPLVTALLTAVNAKARARNG